MLLAVLALFVAGKWWQRHRFLASIRMARITPGELNALLRDGPPTAVVDVRTPERRALTGWIPGSIQVRDVAELAFDPDDEIVVYCDCPNDASAAGHGAKAQGAGLPAGSAARGRRRCVAGEGLPIDREG